VQGGDFPLDGHLLLETAERTQPEVKRRLSTPIGAEGLQIEDYLKAPAETAVKAAVNAAAAEDDDDDNDEEEEEDKKM
jgi:hypothetical protein